MDDFQLIFQIFTSEIQTLQLNVNYFPIILSNNNYKIMKLWLVYLAIVSLCHCSTQSNTTKWEINFQCCFPPSTVIYWHQTVNELFNAIASGEIQRMCAILTCVGDSCIHFLIRSPSSRFTSTYCINSFHIYVIKQWF